MPAWRMLLIGALALVLSGGHLALLQGLAWAGMIVTRSVDRGFDEAVASTFSGAEPCAMCLTVKDLSDTEPTKPDRPRGPDREPLPKILQFKAEAVTACAVLPEDVCPVPEADLPRPDRQRRPAAWDPGVEPPPPRI